MSFLQFKFNYIINGQTIKSNSKYEINLFTGRSKISLQGEITNSIRLIIGIEIDDNL